jgi:hypothetical protein
MTNEPVVDTSNVEVMKRRLVLYDKIKSTKFNKLTIKQGDVNVKFNLKKDLLDQNVDIPEKVLCMLENYEVKSVKQNDMHDENESTASTSPLPPTDTPIKASLSNVSNSETQVTLNKEISSPSTKRVRFDLQNESHAFPSSLQNENKDLTEGAIANKTKSSIIISKITNKEQLNAEKASLLEESTKADKTNELNQQHFICRLCRLKCSNERALYEHVARYVLDGFKRLQSKGNKKI